MTLTTHAIVGASIASIMPSQPVLGFALGFASHFLLDAIPHWDYNLLSSKKDLNNPMNNDLIISKDFFIDLIKIGFDAFLGITVVFILFALPNFNLLWTPLWGAIGAMTPDALQFIYFKWRHEPIVSLQKFHLWVHAKKELKNQPVLGITLQILVVIFFVTVIKLFF